jgi:uncharacterized UPF0160 family protein
LQNGNALTVSNQVHPSGRILLLERDCDWRKDLFTIEKDLQLSGWVYFVVFAETFSGRIRLECVENHNKYLQNGYISTFFDKPSSPPKSNQPLPE